MTECERVGHDCAGHGCECSPAELDCECSVCVDHREDPFVPLTEGDDE